MNRKRFIAAFLALITAVSLAACGGKTVMRKDNTPLLDHTYVNGNQITGLGDPYVFTWDGKYYCTATMSGTSYPLYESEDLREWKKLPDIFFTSGTENWVRRSLWQPQIVAGSDGKFYLYYCGQNDDSSLRIGVAASDSVTGPYEDVHGVPLFDLGFAAIDPNLFVDDDGKMYLYYSRDCSENVVDGKPTSQIYVVEMEDYTHLKEGAEHFLCVTPEQNWEQGGTRWNEGPDILKRDGTYYLFYSGGFYGDRTYSMGYATASSPLGPFVKYDKNPIISTTEAASGPGNNSFFHTLDGKELLNAYHTHTAPAIAGGNRKLTIDRCGWRADGTFYMNGPTTTMQPGFSGHTGLRPVEIKSVAATSTAGGDPMALIDGEFSATVSGVDQEWRGGNGAKDAVTLELAGDTAVNTIFLYRSYEAANTPAKLRIRFSDGSVLKDVAFSSDSAEPAVLHFDDVTTSSVTIEVQDMGSARSFALADVQIYRLEG